MARNGGKNAIVEGTPVYLEVGKEMTRKDRPQS
jgi:hypothetical protein